MISQPLTVAQVSKYLQLKPSTIHRWLRTGRLRGIKIGKFWFVKPEDVEALFVVLPKANR